MIIKNNKFHPRRFLYDSRELKLSEKMHEEECHKHILRLISLSLTNLHLLWIGNFIHIYREDDDDDTQVMLHCIQYVYEMIF
jgi:hypothetical protein